MLDRAERHRDTEIQSLERARSSLTALAQRVEQQGTAEIQSLEHARSGLRQLANRFERPRKVAIQSLKRACSHLAELSERIRQQRTDQAAALRGLAGARSELDELCRLGASARQQELDFLQVLGVHHSEEAHSNVLRWLLDPDETHGKGSSFLRRFMARTAGAAEERDMAGIASSRMQGADWSDVEVLREWNFIDILVLSQRERIVCAIENKIGAAEGFNDQGVSQLTRYRELIEQEFPHHERHFVFLTPSGRPSRVRHEQQFWIPESYTAIQQALKDVLEENEGAESSAALFALAQYETTLRRNIVTSESEVATLARRIYLEHRTAIELAIRHKPNYKADLRQIVMEAVAETDGLLLGRSTDAWVRFQPASWDRFDLQGTGTGWPPSKALILFEVNCAQENPLGSGLSLCLGPGSDAAIRERLWDFAIRNPHLFKTSGSMGDSYTHLLRDPVALLTEEDLGLAWDDGRAAERIRGRLSRFFEERLPAIDQIVTKCFETQPRSESAHEPITPPSDSETSA